MKHYWTPVEHELLRKAGTLSEIVSVAIEILKRMSLEGKPIVQICGPMTTGGRGNFRLNMKRFRRAIEHVHAQGKYVVFDQMIFTEAFVRLDKQRGADYNKVYWMGLIEGFYAQVFRSGYIKGTLWLSDWQSSKGATREREVAIECGLFMEDLPDELFLVE